MKSLQNPLFWLAIGAFCLITPFVDVAVHPNDHYRVISDLHWAASKVCTWIVLLIIIGATIKWLLYPLVMWVVNRVK